MCLKCRMQNEECRMPEVHGPGARPRRAWRLSLNRPQTKAFTVSFLVLMLPLAALLGCKSAPPSGAAETGGPTEAVVAIDPETEFAVHAFPPTLSDTEQHRNAWQVLDCMDCHEEGIADAPLVQHRGMPERLLTAQCRTCHVLIPGQTEDEVVIRAD